MTKAPSEKYHKIIPVKHPNSLLSVFRIFQIFVFSVLLWKHLVLNIFWRIPYVENVIRDPTQLSGRGFPHNFYIELVSSIFRVSRAKRGICFWCLRTAPNHTKPHHTTPHHTPKELEKHFFLKLVTQWGWREALFCDIGDAMGVVRSTLG